MTARQKVGFLGILMSVALALVIAQFNAVLALSAVVLLGLLILMIAFPEIGTIIVIFVLYTNIAGIAVNSYGIPAAIGKSFSLILGLPLVSYLIIQRQKLVIDRTFLLMLVFLGGMLLSSLVAVDLNLALDEIIEFLVEGLVLYLLLINVIRKYVTLKRVIWTLILAAGMLGGFTTYQELTNSYDQEFGGLAPRSSLAESGTVADDEGIQINRAGGPLDGNPNRYAQILMIIFPLALFRVWAERSFWLRALALGASALIISGMLLTYSRGAFVTLVLILLAMTLLRYIRLHQILISVAVVVILVSLVAPGYLYRLDSLRGVEGLFSDQAEAEPDYVTRSRVTEMLAALNVFLDHPIIGVGPGQYTPYYSIDYQLDPDIALRYIPKTRRAHTLYFELGAETGIIGLGTFLVILLLIMYRLWRARRRWTQIRADRANIAMALLLSLCGYLGTAAFLHLSYQRYYWLLVALATAAIQIFEAEYAQEETLAEAPSLKGALLPEHAVST
jgi:putative inorganic carbon (HCO3(-)) transporter